MPQMENCTVRSTGLLWVPPLGCLLADMYMCHVENQVLEDVSIKPHLYSRYVDDVFVDVKDL